MARLGGLFKVLDASITKDNPKIPESTRYYDCVAWGCIAKGPEEVISSMVPKPHIKMGIRWRKHQFVNCTVYQENPYAYAVARKLQLGDPVAVAGKMKEYVYTPKKGKNAGIQKQFKEMEVHLIFPARLIAALMEEADAAVAPDTIAGLEEYLRENPEKDDALPW